ncbi:MAG: MFS transporter [Christensenellaceae bacterium]|nr:MFS transporter [Christensenellaceae bacterium]
MTNISHRQDRFPAAFYMLIVIQFLQSLSFYMIAPIFTKYLTGQGIPLAMAGTLSGLMSYTCLVTRPFSGRLADWADRRKILTGSSVLFGVSIMLYACVSSQAGIVVLRVMTGVAFCLSGTTLFAFAGHFIPETRMGEGVGYVGLGHIIASAVGPLLGSSLAEAFGIRISFILAGAASLICVLLLLTPPFSAPVAAAKQPERDARGSSRPARNRWIAPALIPIACLGSLFSYTSSTVSNFLVLYADARGIVNATLYFTVLAAALFILRPFLGKAHDRFGISSVLIPGLILSMAGVLMMMRATGIVHLLVAAVLLAFGQGGAQPAVQASCLKSLSADQRGVATSTYYIFNDLMQGIAPSLGGAAIQYSGYNLAFSLCIVFFAVGLIYYLCLAHYQKKRARQHTSA